MENGEIMKLKSKDNEYLIKIYNILKQFDGNIIKDHAIIHDFNSILAVIDKDVYLYLHEDISDLFSEVLKSFYHKSCDDWIIYRLPLMDLQRFKNRISYLKYI